MSFAIRSASADDLDQAVALAAITFPLACPPDAEEAAVAEHVRTQLNLTAFTAWLASPSHDLLVGFAPDESVAAYALVHRARPQDDAIRDLVGAGPVAELSKIYVDPSHQGTGLAGALLREALGTSAAKLGHERHWLGTNGQNLRAQAFYRRHGFRVVGTRTYVVGGQAHDDVVMLRGA